MRPFRFGVVAAQAASGADWLAKAQRIETMGYSTLVMPDGMRYTLGPFPALAAAAAATTRLRVGSYVLANDFRHPTMLAKEAATLDFVSGGRFELGMGAGRPSAVGDNHALGLDFASGGVRLARLAESIGIVRRLLAGETVTHTGTHYSLTAAQVTHGPTHQPPILIAGSGPKLLELAAREADIVALGTAPDEPEAQVAQKIDHLRQGAGDRFADLELNVNLMAVGERVPRYVQAQLGLDAAALARANAVAAVTGSTQDMCDLLVARRERLGISYFLVADELMDAFAPVMERLSGS
ncbi:MAG TPA: TIGR03621 family F420-dependent LLM class oxidoreductase [Chloroflexota bacterium]